MKRSILLSMLALSLGCTQSESRPMPSFPDPVSVLYFVGIECPMSNARIPRMIDLAKEFPNVSFCAVYSNFHETQEQIDAHAKKYGLPFKVIKDERHELADKYKIDMIPSAVILDQKGELRYRGRIDDHKVEEFVTSRDLRKALMEVLDGKPVSTPETPVEGCVLAREEKATSTEVTYARDIAPILNNSCVTCHRPEGAAPFSLVGYDQARAWAKMVKRSTQAKRMPPWKPVTNHGLYHNERRLTDDEIAKIARWADSGAPKGDDKDLPPEPKFKDGWLLGTPDLVLKAEGGYEIAAKGSDVYRCYVLKTDFDEDKWVKAVEYRPGNMSVVHHIIAYIDTSGAGARKDQADALPGYETNGAGPGIMPQGSLGGWAPGNFPRMLQPGVAFRLPRGAHIILETHYHKSGRKEVDQGTQIGLYFAKEPITKRIRYHAIINTWFRIPAGAEAYKATANWKVPQDIHALDVMPHMHLLGREAHVVATLPDGKKQDLVVIKDWDFNWQETYQFKQPLALPKGTKVQLTMIYDNSEKNRNNPSRPPKPVTWGYETTDEMCIAFIAYTVDSENLGK